jgi:cobyrinic acid a,c-diamide synthase
VEQRSEFIIGATKSGSGKTLLTLGILAALAKRKIVVQPFKCGPDFIDPTLHQMMVSRPSINLDLHMMGTEGCLASYDRYGSGAEAVVVEGVMGLFDGGIASTAALGVTLDIPVVLVVDVRSAAESIAAVIKGFELYNPDLRICGVICNQVGSKRHEKMIQDAVDQSCKSEILGFFPRNVSFELPSRHLGLHMGQEVSMDGGQVDTLVSAIEKNINIERLLQLSISSSKHANQSVLCQGKSLDKVRLAVAQDAAFCFYYRENLQILKEHGFELVYFSPLKDTKLPSGIDGIYLGGGYPELFAEQLSINIEMRRSLLKWVEGGGFVYAECGGLMYLTESLTDLSGKSFPMTGVFPVTVRMKPRFSRLGYRTVTLNDDSLLGLRGQMLFGHEFHYSEIETISDGIDRLYELEDGRKEGYRVKNVMGSYVHLHFAKTPESIRHMYTTLHKSKTGRLKNG